MIKQTLKEGSTIMVTLFRSKPINTTTAPTAPAPQWERRHSNERCRAFSKIVDDDMRRELRAIGVSTVGIPTCEVSDDNIDVIIAAFQPPTRGIAVTIDRARVTRVAPVIHDVVDQAIRRLEEIPREFQGVVLQNCSVSVQARMVGQVGEALGFKPQYDHNSY